MTPYSPAVAAWVFGSLRVTSGFAFTAPVIEAFIAAGRRLETIFKASFVMAGLVIIIGNVGSTLLIFSGPRVVQELLTPWRAPAT